MPKKTSKPPELVPIGGKHLSSVRKARAALMARANEIVDKFMAIIDQAAAAGDYETATRSMQWLLEHMPDEDGIHTVNISIDKPKAVEAGPKGPMVQVGIALGGIGPQKALPEVTVIEPTEQVPHE